MNDDTVKCPKCNEITLYKDKIDEDEIWCLNENCDYDATICTNDGKCVVYLNFGNDDVTYISEPYCKCSQDYREINNQVSKDVNTLMEKTFPGQKFVVWYHPAWWELDGLTEDPFAKLNEEG